MCCTFTTRTLTHIQTNTHITFTHTGTHTRRQELGKQNNTRGQKFDEKEKEKKRIRRRQKTRKNELLYVVAIIIHIQEIECCFILCSIIMLFYIIKAEKRQLRRHTHKHTSTQTRRQSPKNLHILLKLVYIVEKKRRNKE